MDWRGGGEQWEVVASYVQGQRETGQSLASKAKLVERLFVLSASRSLSSSGQAGMWRKAKSDLVNIVSVHSPKISGSKINPPDCLWLEIRPSRPLNYLKHIGAAPKKCRAHHSALEGQESSGEFCLILPNVQPCTHVACISCNLCQHQTMPFVSLTFWKAHPKTKVASEWPQPVPVPPLVAHVLGIPDLPIIMSRKHKPRTVERYMVQAVVLRYLPYYFKRSCCIDDICFWCISAVLTSQDVGA